MPSQEPGTNNSIMRRLLNPLARHECISDRDQRLSLGPAEQQSLAAARGGAEQLHVGAVRGVGGVAKQLRRLRCISLTECEGGTQHQRHAAAPRWLFALELPRVPPHDFQQRFGIGGTRRRRQCAAGRRWIMKMRTDSTCNGRSSPLPAIGQRCAARPPRRCLDRARSGRWPSAW